VNASVKAEYFEVSHLSYSTARFRISEATGKEKTFTLEVKPIQLQEISVVPKDARGIVEMAMNRVRQNYAETPNLMTAFYRESIRQKKDYISLSEAVVDIYKAPYTGLQNDQVKIYKGRKGTNVLKADTLLVKLQGGPNVSLLLDIVKNTDLGIALYNLDSYHFEIGKMVSIDDQLNWVISFSPAEGKDEPLYFGKLYIAQNDLAVTRAEFNLDLRQAEKAASIFIQKKPSGMNFVPTFTSYLVTYKKQQGRYYLSYLRADVQFGCDWSKRGYKNTYTVMSEMAVTDRKEKDVEKFTGDEIFRSYMVLTEKVENFEDADFWGTNNIIEPDESIETAIKKLSKSMKR
jgi:hypothetical protein